MPVHQQWYNAEKTIYYYKVVESLDWAEVKEAILQGWSDIGSVSHPVNVLLDISDSIDHLPPGLFTYGTWILRDAPPNIQYRVIAGMKPRSRSVLGLFLRLNNILPSVRRLHFFDTPEEGIQFLVRALQEFP